MIGEVDPGSAAWGQCFRKNHFSPKYKVFAWRASIMAANLTGVALPRLEWFKPRILQEAEFLVFSVRQLKEADARNARALETLEILIRRRTDEFLVPLTSCMRKSTKIHCLCDVTL
ncbi:hypothetical protein ATANTOWER_018912 [Ataeniobius toweri]|uniref:Uncharacterized protein n=1 Tax=Ataeniobius toweri TaxID=208326 RepID=A0ABU7BHG1_9TELE|nr:hypothetical protein [Ataeniobius toweri]